MLGSGLTKEEFIMSRGLKKKLNKLNEVYELNKPFDSPSIWTKNPRNLEEMKIISLRRNEQKTCIVNLITSPRPPTEIDFKSNAQYFLRKRVRPWLVYNSSHNHHPNWHFKAEGKLSISDTKRKLILPICYIFFQEQGFLSSIRSIIHRRKFHHIHLQHFLQKTHVKMNKKWALHLKYQPKMNVFSAHK